MSEQPSISPVFAEQIDRLFAVLMSSPELLQQGRSHGLAVGLSPAIVAEMIRRHGEDAAEIMNNTWRVDSKARLGWWAGA